jgi:hypothetical protein
MHQASKRSREGTLECIQQYLNAAGDKGVILQTKSRIGRVDIDCYDGADYTGLLIPQVRPARKYPISPWEMIHLPGGDNAVCR